jgi:hypothetical protein
MSHLGGTEGVDFVVRNYQAVRALRDLSDEAGVKLPLWIARRLKRRWENEDALDGWEVRAEKDYVSCISPDSKRSDGCELSYGIESLTLDALGNDEGDGSAPLAYLYLECPKAPNKQQSKWRERTTGAARAARKELGDKGYDVLPDGSDDYAYYLIKRSIHQVLNISEIARDVDAAIDEATKVLLQTIKDTRDILMSSTLRSR